MCVWDNIRVIWLLLSSLNCCVLLGSGLLTACLNTTRKVQGFMFFLMYSSFSLVTFKAAVQELLTLKPQELRPRSEKVHRELCLEDLMKVSEHFVWPTKLRFSHWSCWGFRSSGIWCCFLEWVGPNRFKECSMSFFKGQGVQVQIMDCLTFEDEGNVILWNIRNHSPNDTVTHLRIYESFMWHTS